MRRPTIESSVLLRAYCFIFNVTSVPVGVSQVLASLPALRMLPTSSPLHPHVEGVERFDEDAQRLGSPESRQRVKAEVIRKDGRTGAA